MYSAIFFSLISVTAAIRRRCVLAGPGQHDQQRGPCFDRYGSACPAVLSGGCAHRWRKLCPSGAATSFARARNRVAIVGSRAHHVSTSAALPSTTGPPFIAIALLSKGDDRW